LDLYKKILVCVTKQKNCERLIEAASKHRMEQGSLHVLHVAKNSWNILDNSSESEALEYLFKISKSYGAEMTMLRNDNISETIAEFAKQREIDLIVLGESLNKQENNFLKQLRFILKDKPVKIIEIKH